VGSSSSDQEALRPEGGTLRIIKRLEQLLSYGPVAEANLQRRAYRLAPGGVPTTFWERRVLELCDGRTLESIILDIYVEELRGAAWATDIRLWKPLFDRGILETIESLYQRGLVRLESMSEETDKLSNPQEETVLIPPYGGTLINLLAPPEDVEELKSLASTLPSIQLSQRSECELISEVVEIR
jgi:hypothetical protein